MGNQKLPVDIVFDADSQFNQAVALQALECGKALFSKGYEVNYLSWPAEYGKGFDDLANNRKLGSCRRIPGSEMFACMESVLSEAS